MADDFRPKHLRGLPSSVRLTPEEEREHMDLQSDLDRVRRKYLSEHSEGEEPWAFPVPRPMALLFDRLPSPFTAAEALEAGEGLGLDAKAVAEAVTAMRRYELVSDAPEIDGQAAYVRHTENRNWF